MKKLLSLLSVLLLITPLYAQQITLNRQNARQELTSLFHRADQAALRQEVMLSLGQNGNPLHSAATAQTSRPERNWQIALFLADANRPISETLKTLRYQMTTGYLKQAAVLDITPRTGAAVKKDKRPSQQTAYPATFYFLYMADGKPVTEKVAASSEVPANDLLEPLFHHFHKSKQTYSAAIIDSHSSGFDMFYGKEGWLDTEHVLSALQAAGLKLDVLNINACHMGSFYNLHKLAQYKNVSYLVASSDIMMGNTAKMYYTFLHQLKYAPRQAAVNTSVSIQKTYSGGADTSYNSIVLELDNLSAPVLEWFTDYGLLMTAGSENLQKQMLRPFDPRWGKWRSFIKILRRQIAYLQEHEQEISQQGRQLPQLSQDFIASGQQLLQALQKGTLTQWCYSAQYGKYFFNRIPPNIDCMDGVSVTKDQLSQLLKEERASLEEIQEEIPEETQDTPEEEIFRPILW